MSDTESSSSLDDDDSDHGFDELTYSNKQLLWLSYTAVDASTASAASASNDIEIEKDITDNTGERSSIRVGGALG